MHYNVCFILFKQLQIPLIVNVLSLFVLDSIDFVMYKKQLTNKIDAKSKKGCVEYQIW